MFFIGCCYCFMGGLMIGSGFYGFGFFVWAIGFAIMTITKLAEIKNDKIR